MVVAKENQATLLLVNVVDTKSFGSITAYDLKYADQLVNENKEKLENLKKKVIESGVDHVEIFMEKCSPKEILTNLPDVSLTVCGATGLSKVEKAIMGSVAERIVRYSRNDVLIVRN